MPAAQNRPRRLIWCINHKTLMPAEVPIFRKLGYEVLITKIIPDHDPGYRSAAVTYDYDAELTIPQTALAVLNEHNFYERSWSPTIRQIINEHFDVFISHFSYYTIPLSEAARHFEGLVVARTFGREYPKTYSEFTDIGPRKNLLWELEALGDRFIHAQGYANIAEIEPKVLQRTAVTVTVPMPKDIYTHAGTWAGKGCRAVFLCPAIGLPGDKGYYTEVYENIKAHFSDLPHWIFGRQSRPVNDPAVLPYLSEVELIALYQEAPVFVYPSREPRHVHYSPVEAMVVGTPVLYFRGALLDMITGGSDLAGACADIDDMREKTARLLAGDRALASAIRAGQDRIVATFGLDLAERQWAEALAPDLGGRAAPRQEAGRC